MRTILTLLLLAIGIPSILRSQAPVNLAYLQPAQQSSTANDGVASRAVDGNSSGLWGDGSVTHTESTAQPWWEVDLGSVQEIGGIQIWNRTDCCKDRLSQFYVFISESPILSEDPGTVQTQPGVFSVYETGFPDPDRTWVINQSGRYVRLQLSGTNPLSLAEVQVWQSPGGDFQTIDFPSIGKQLATIGGLSLTATATSGLPVSFTLISGPATLAGNLLTFTGASGTLVVRADQPGDGTFGEAVSVERTFDVVNPADVSPVIEIRSPGPTYPLYMPQLGWTEICTRITIDHDDVLDIGVVQADIDGIPVVLNAGADGFYRGWWPAATYGTHQLVVTAAVDGGGQATKSRYFDVTSTGLAEKVTTFDHGQIFNGGPYRYSGTYELPSSTGGYAKITGTLSITCPPGGCDPWDRIAQVSVRGRDGQWYEIIRYITPYGVECTHSIDLTRFADLLQGEVDWRMDLVTYQNGWEFTLDLDYEPGTVIFPYSRVEKLWTGNFPFGDPKNLQPLDTFQIQFSPQAQEAELFVVNTGHGWGENNTSNAAEFFEADHVFKINGQGALGQKLWTACNPNPDGCSPQNGTWTYNRAGWCPGAISPGYSYNLSGWILDGGISLSYIFDNYIDLCHPNNPGCISGITCPNCKDGFNPQYVIASYLVTYGFEPVMPSGIQTSTDDPGQEVRAEGLKIVPNPSIGRSLLVLDKPEDGTYRITDLQGRTLAEGIFRRNDAESGIELIVPAPFTGLCLVQARTRYGVMTGKWMVRQP